MSTTRVVLNEKVVAMNTVTAPSAHVTTHSYSPDRLWRELPEIYNALEIPIGLANASDRRLGNESLRVRRKLGGMPMSRVLNCGGSQGAPNAESYEVTLYVTSQVLAKAEGSSLSTVVEGTARPVNFSGESVPCTSLGTLERRIDELLRVRLELSKSTQ